MENCPYCGAPGSFREAVDGCCYVCGMVLPESSDAAPAPTGDMPTQPPLDRPTNGPELSGTDSTGAATIQLQPPTYVPPVEDTIEPPAIELIQPRNLSPEYARRVTAAWQATKSPFRNPQETINSGSNAVVEDANLLIGSRSVADASGNKPADYELNEVIGEGNMGTVWGARQASLDRQVALKRPKRSAAGTTVGRELFISEVVVTGQLDHPNIVPIYDLARDESGQLFYAMKRVEGRSWDQCMHEDGHSRLDNVEILMKVCDAIRFAHDRGVIHRDIKPQNIMVGKYGEVAVMDWGIALRLPEGPQMPGATKLSPSGTPAYMAPEMATGNANDLGPHTDVYLLGAVLYEIITGEPPHPAPDSSHDPFVQQNACLLIAARNVITPAKETGELVDIAYKAMATDIADRFQTVDEFQNAIRDYYSHSESIVLTDRGEDHLAKATEARNGVYEDYNKARFAFGEALDLWPENSRARSGLAKSTLEHANTALQRGDYALGLSLLDRENPAHSDLVKKLTTAKRKADRNRFAALVSEIAAVSILVLGIAICWYFYRQAASTLAKLETTSGDLASAQRNLEAKNREIATKERDLKTKETELAGLLKTVSDTSQRLQTMDNDLKDRNQKLDAAKTELDAQISKADAAQKQANQASYRSELGRAAEEAQRNAFDNARGILAALKNQDADDSLRGWEWGHLMYLAENPSISRFEIEGLPRVASVAFSPNGQWMVAGTDDNSAFVWWRPDPSRPPTKIEHSAPVSAVAITDDSKLLVTAADKEVRFWTLPSDKPDERLQPAGEPLRYSSPILSVAVSPTDPDIVVTSATDSTAQLWSRKSPGQPKIEFAGHVKPGPVWQARFSPDGKRIVTAGEDGSVRIWEVDTGLGQPFGAHRGPVYAAEFSPDGKSIVSGGRDRRLLVWNVPGSIDIEASAELIRSRLERIEESASDQGLHQLGEHDAAIRSLSFSADGKHLFTASDDNSLKVWDLSGGLTNREPLKTLRGHGGWVRSCAAAPDGQLVLSGSHDGQLFLWDWTKYDFPRVLRPESELTRGAVRFTSAAVSPDSRWIATSAENGTTTIWDMSDPLNPTSQSLREGHDWQATTGVYFPGGNQLLTAAGDNSTLVWDTRRGNQILRIGGWNRPGGTGWRGVAAVSHNGRAIATGSDESTSLARLWDAQTGKLLATFRTASSRGTALNQGESPEATTIAFSPDDDFVFVGDQWGGGHLFKAADGALVSADLRHRGKINAAAFLADGRLLTAGTDKKVVLWNIQNASTPRVDRAFEHDGRVIAMDVSPDGSRFITATDSNDGDAVLRVWETSSGHIVERLTFSQLTGIANRSKNDKQVVRSVAFNPSGAEALITMFDPRIPDQPYRLGKWAWGNSSTAVQWLPNRLRDTSMALYSPNRDGAILTVGGRGARLRFASQPMNLGSQLRVLSVAFSPDSDLLASAGADGSIKLWRLDGNRWLPDQKLIGGHQGPVHSVDFHPQGDILLSAGDDGRVQLWQHAAGGWNPQPLSDDVAQGPVKQARFAILGDPAAIHVLTAADNAVKLWTLDGRLLRTLPHDRSVQAVAVSPDRRWIVTAAQDEAWIWNAASGQLEPVQRLTGHSSDVTSLAFSPAGDRLFTASDDLLIKLWDTAAWSDTAGMPAARELMTLKQHSGEVKAISFLPSPKYPSLLSVGTDGQAILWPSVSWQD